MISNIFQDPVLLRVLYLFLHLLYFEPFVIPFQRFQFPLFSFSLRCKPLKSWASLRGAAFQLAVRIAGFVEVLSVTRLLPWARLFKKNSHTSWYDSHKTDLEVNIRGYFHSALISPFWKNYNVYIHMNRGRSHVEDSICHLWTISTTLQVWSTQCLGMLWTWLRAWWRMPRPMEFWLMRARRDMAGQMLGFRLERPSRRGMEGSAKRLPRLWGKCKNSQVTSYGSCTKHVSLRCASPAIWIRAMLGSEDKMHFGDLCWRFETYQSERILGPH